MKNVELNNQSSDRQVDDNDFLGSSVYGGLYIKETDRICLFNIFLMYNFELICPDLVMSDQAQLICDSQKINFIPLPILEIFDFQEPFKI